MNPSGGAAYPVSTRLWRGLPNLAVLFCLPWMWRFHAESKEA